MNLNKNSSTNFSKSLLQKENNLPDHAKASVTQGKRKKITLILLLVIPLMISIFVAIYMVILNGKNAKAQSGSNSESEKIISEITSEQLSLEQQRKQLEDYERTLKAYELELESRNNDYLQKMKSFEIQVQSLKTKEELFNKRVDDKVVDRQTIETYENIDPEQAAILLKNLYEKDSQLAVLIMRKIAGKKAGKILEAMIPLDKETSTKLAKESMDFYKNLK